MMDLNQRWVAGTGLHQLPRGPIHHYRVLGGVRRSPALTMSAVELSYSPPSIWCHLVPPLSRAQRFCLPSTVAF
jgi:hypothetical protein